MVKKVLKHYGKIFNKQVETVAYRLGNGWLIDTEEAKELIKCLEYYLSSFNQEEINKFNKDLSIIYNGGSEDGRIKTLSYLKGDKDGK